MNNKPRLCIGTNIIEIEHIVFSNTVTTNCLQFSV